MINLPSWLSFKPFEGLRQDFLGDQRLVSIIRLCPGIFGSDFGSVTFVVSNARSSGGRAVYRRLFDQHDNVRFVATIEALLHDRDYNLFEVAQSDFAAIPGSPVIYWLSEKMRAAFASGKPLRSIASLAVGLQTGDNNRFLRQWWEVSTNRTAFSCTSREEATNSGARWFPYNKGGEFRKWYGNQEHVVNWENDGAEIIAFKPRSVIRNPGTYFSPSVSWSKISSGSPAFRSYPPGFIYDVAGTSIFAENNRERLEQLSFTNSTLAQEQLSAIAPTLNFEVGQVAGLPIADLSSDSCSMLAAQAVKTAREDWDLFETSWNFLNNPLIELMQRG